MERIEGRARGAALLRGGRGGVEDGVVGSVVEALAQGAVVVDLGEFAGGEGAGARDGVFLHFGVNVWVAGGGGGGGGCWGCEGK